MKGMKENINKDTEILKNNQYEKNNSTFQIKISVESLVNRMEHIENRVSG
jgi:hypothetical protein